MLQKFPIGGFKWFKETVQFSEDFKKSYNEDSYEGFSFLKLMRNCRNCRICRIAWLCKDLPFLSKRMKIANVGNMQSTFMIKNLLHISKN